MEHRIGAHRKNEAHPAADKDAERLKHAPWLTGPLRNQCQREITVRRADIANGSGDFLDVFEVLVANPLDGLIGVIVELAVLRLGIFFLPLRGHRKKREVRAF